MFLRRITAISGQTALERRCRLLFGLLIVALVSAALLWVSTIVDKQARETARAAGRQFVDAYQLQYHWSEWENREESKPLVKIMCDSLQLQNYEAEFLALEPVARDSVSPPADEAEREILLRLRTWQRQQLDAQRDASGPSSETVRSAGDSGEVKKKSNRQEFLPVFEERFPDDSEEGKYVYYQPVYWTNKCVLCHRALSSPSAFTTIPEGEFYDEDGNFRVVKVAFSIRPQQRAIAMTRAKLLTAGIVTLFVSMLCMFLLIRVVVVRPLQRQPEAVDETEESVDS